MVVVPDEDRFCPAWDVAGAAAAGAANVGSTPQTAGSIRKKKTRVMTTRVWTGELPNTSRQPWQKIRQKKLWGHVPHAVVRAERVPHAMSAFAVITPLSVHHEAVLVGAGRKRKADLPHAVIFMAHEDGIFFPVGEGAEEQDFLGLRGDELECFLFHVV